MYIMSREAVIKYFNSDLHAGLSSEQIQDRLKIYGKNELPEAPSPSILTIFINQFKNPLIYLLVVAAALISLLGNYSDALVTIIVILFNACIGTMYEKNAHKTVQGLKKLIKVSALVIRNKQRIIVDSSELVPGDIIILAEGDQIPADARILTSDHLLVNESVLTGESHSVEKNDRALAGQRQIFEQDNMVFRGSTVTSGFAVALVASTGSETEIGKIQKAAELHESESPLNNELNKLSHSLSVFAIILCSALFVLGYLTNKPLSELLGVVVALFIGIVPEGLPVVFALTLITGARRLARKNVLVKQLSATEGLGRVDVIVIDKTGTLTRNEMVVRKVYTSNATYDVEGEGYSTHGALIFNKTPVPAKEHSDVLSLAIACGLLDSSERKYNERTKHYQVKGEPTEAALGVFSQKMGIQKESHKLAHEIPFDFALRLKIGFYKTNETTTLFISGSPEAVFAACHTIDREDKDALQQFLEQGYRVVALASYQTTLQEPVDWLQFFKECSEKFNLLGIVAIQDSIRPDVSDALAQAQGAGIHVIMATGDHKLTATHIARQTGILKDGDLVLTGNELSGKSVEQVELLDLEKIKVFARVTPHDKLTLVSALKKRGKIVAMTGDGINDVPSIVAADVGIAMGLIGTDVAKESADLILMDDSFSSIVKGVIEGRHIFATLRRIIWYFFSTNLSEVIVIVFAFLAGMPLPLRAAQILWLNVVTDGFLDVALSMEPHEPSILSPKTKVQHSLIDSSLITTKILPNALLMAVGALCIFSFWYPFDLPEAQTMTLLCMAMFQWFNAWNCRSERLSIQQCGFFKNKWLIASTLLVAALQVAVIYEPTLQRLFKTVPLSLAQWILVALIASSIIVLEEVRKALAKWRSMKSH